MITLQLLYSRPSLRPTTLKFFQEGRSCGCRNKNRIKSNTIRPRTTKGIHRMTTKTTSVPRLILISNKTATECFKRTKVPKVWEAAQKKIQITTLLQGWNLKRTCNRFSKVEANSKSQLIWRSIMLRKSWSFLKTFTTQVAHLVTFNSSRNNLWI